MSYKYRLYCNTDTKWEYIWNDVDPGVTVAHGITECPTNGVHTINSNSIKMIDLVENKHRINTNFKIKQRELSTTTYTEINTFIFEGSDVMGTFIYFKVISSMNEHSQGKTGDTDFDYTIRIYDKTNRNLICTNTISGNPLENTFTCTTGSNIPTGEATLSVQVINGLKGGDININYVELLFKKDPSSN